MSKTDAEHLFDRRSRDEVSTLWEPMPDKPSLGDFFNLRFSRIRNNLPFAPGKHVIQCATLATRAGQPEETVLACLLHDLGLWLIKPDHGWWGAQLVEPYVSE